MRPRRFQPSVSLLTAFEAVLRTGSTAAAARELDLTQSTVSRLVQNLEQQLGHPLFERSRKRLIPTDSAIAYGRDVTRALDLIQRSSMEFVSNPTGGTLSLAILPGFGTHWLTPRLGSFLNQHPGVTINLATRLKRFNFAAETFDAAIHFGADDWRDAEHLHLLEERMTACISPSRLAKYPVDTARDVKALPLLRIETRPTAWRKWFEAHDEETPEITGLVVDQFAALTQAAIAGLGVALLPDFLAAEEVRSGRLVTLLNPSAPSSGSYWLVWPEASKSYPPLVAFRNWIAGQEIDFRN